LGRQQATVGQEADLPECGKVVEAFADPEVARVVDRGLGPKGAVELVVLLDLGVLVVDVQRRLHAVVDHPGPKPPRVVLMRWRAKMSETRSGRPASRLSRITSSKKTRPARERSRTWMRANSACRARR